MAAPHPVDPRYSKICGIPDRELRHSLQWLNRLPDVVDINLGKKQIGPVRGHYTGQLRVQGESSNGLWIKGYLPDGVRHIYVSAPEESRAHLRALIDTAFPPHKQGAPPPPPVAFNTPRFVTRNEPPESDTTVAPQSVPDHEPAQSALPLAEVASAPGETPAATEETDMAAGEGAYIDTRAAARILGCSTTSSVGYHVKTGKLRSKYGLDTSHRKILLVNEADVQKLKATQTPNSGGRGKPRSQRPEQAARRVPPSSKRAATLPNVPPASPAVAALPLDNGPEVPRAATATSAGALLGLMVRELRALRQDMHDMLAKMTEKLDQNNREQAALRELFLQDRVSMEEIVRTQ